MKVNEFMECFIEYVNIRNGKYMSDKVKELFEHFDINMTKIDELELLQSFLESLTKYGSVTID